MGNSFVRELLEKLKGPGFLVVQANTCGPLGSWDTMAAMDTRNGAPAANWISRQRDMKGATAMVDAKPP